MSTPSKAQDPAAAALSAIEDALRLNLEPEASTPASKGSAEAGAPEPDAPKSEPPAPETPEGLPKLDFHLPSPRGEAGDATAPRMPEIASDELAPPARSPDPARGASSPRPANDDRPSVGQILQTLQTRPDSSAFTVAIIASAAWIGLWIGYFIFTHGAAFSGSLFSPPATISAFALIGPVLFFLTMGAVLRRSQEMRHTARSMAEVAIRLAEPETIATEQVVTLSQAIRREVASMGDGIERALARAGELESMVRAEVTSLERTYGDNERRIRILLNELSSERESIVANADQISSALADAHTALSTELENATKQLTEMLERTGDRIAKSLEDKGGAIESAFSQSGDTLLRQVEERAQNLLDTFRKSSEDTARMVEERATRIDGDLRGFAANFLDQAQARTNDLSQSLDAASARLGDTI
ncbi:MAG TPA: apolipoprotein acyltransferase, partial [Rhodoblastus sp.]|nr:apolipoprotein acyltransferase [Rhodoblastus sp.]